MCLPFVLFACEAPLEMQGVEETLEESVRRTDVVQDVVVLPDQTLFVGSKLVMRVAFHLFLLAAKLFTKR